jgi:hypothetical protein
VVGIHPERGRGGEWDPAAAMGRVWRMRGGASAQGSWDGEWWGRAPALSLDGGMEWGMGW